jgi:hypothetical protein
MYVSRFHTTTPKLITALTASEQPSDAEIKQGEEEAAANVRNFAVGCLVLYLSMSESSMT